MNRLRTPIAELLEDDTTLAGLVGSRIYHPEAPQDATYPLVIFHKQSGTPRWTFQGPPVQDDLWTIKAVDPSSATVEPIADAIDDAVSDAALDFGGDTLEFQRQSDVNYGEAATGKTYRHLGAIYRVITSE